MRSSDEENLGPVIRDRRRIDPVTGQARDAGQPGTGGRGQGPARPGRHSASRPGGQAGQGAAGQARDSKAGGQEAAGAGRDRGQDASAKALAEAERAAAEASARLAERTADLQRLQAEYANYRKRVERDRLAVREQALANVLAELLPVLDDIGLAREHGELSGGFKSVADSLESATTKLGLVSYGENGDPFDPNVHEALMHSYSDEVSEPTCARILQPGYKVGDRILRPARVAVAEPGEQPAAAAKDADSPGRPPGTDSGDGDADGGEPGGGAPEGTD